VEELAATLERRGIVLPPQDLECIKPVFRAYLAELAKLRALDLKEAEVAFVFRPIEQLGA
jgi:hypothetical protein